MNYHYFRTRVHMLIGDMNQMLKETGSIPETELRKSVQHGLQEAKDALDDSHDALVKFIASDAAAAKP